MVVRGNRAWMSTPTASGLSMPVPKEMNGKSGSMGADAFQQLARYVRDVRVAEHQQIEGKSVTTIAGEIDTAGLLKAVTKLGSLSGPGGEKPAFAFDLDDLGLKIGDIKAVLSIDESTHLLSTALVTLGMDVAGQEAEARAALPAHELERAGQVPVRLRLATTFGAWTPTASGGCECRPSSSRRSRCSSRCGDDSREDVDARSEPVLALTATRRDRDRPGLEHRTHALRRPRVRRRATSPSGRSSPAGSSPSRATSSSAARSTSAPAAWGASARSGAPGTSSASRWRRLRSR